MNNKNIEKTIENRIQLIRGMRVMIDADLAELYGTSTKVLNQAVKRNINRFPSDFMFYLNSSEKSKVVTNCDHLNGLKFSKTMPLAFTEHGAIMAANVINSSRAVEMSVFVVRAFVRFRETLYSNKEIGRIISELEEKVGIHDEAIKKIILTIREMIDGKDIIKKRKIGFKPGKNNFSKNILNS